MLPILPASSRQYDVVVFGENSLDFVGRTAGDAPTAGKHTLTGFETCPGGQAATAAVGCARQGVRVCYVGVFGVDGWGAMVRAALAREHMDVLALERQGACTRVAIVLVDPQGERSVLEYRDAKLVLDDPSPAIQAAAKSRIVLVDATDAAASIAVARAARAAGAKVVVDIDRVVPVTADLLAAIDVIIVPDVFVTAFSGRDNLLSGMRDIAGRFTPELLVATCGPAGSIAMIDGREIRTPAFDVPVLDTTGAGDAFRAGFCSAWAFADAETRIEEVLAAANATAALNCRSRGAQAGLPDRAAVWDLVTRTVQDRSNSQ